jgi:transporter family protein
MTTAAWVPFLAATVLFYGLAQALTKQFMSGLSAGAFIALYLGVKLVVNGIAFFALGHVGLFAPGSEHFILIALGGNLINGVAWLFFYKALEQGKVSLVGSITAGYPALTVILALFFLGEHLKLHQGFGVVAVIASGVLVALQPDAPIEPSENLAVAPASRAWLFYSLIVFVGWGVFSALIKAAFNAPMADTYTFFVWNAVGALAVLGPYAIVANWGQKLGRPSELALALVPTLLFALGDLALFRAFEMGPAAIVAPMSTVYPLVTLLYAVPVLRERMAPAQWVAVGLLLLGIVVVSIG